MPGTPVTITTASVPAGLCFTSLADAWATLVPLLSAILSGNNTPMTVSKTTPSAENQDRPWFKLDSRGYPERLYYFSGGLWLAKHPSPFGGQERRLWVGSTTDLLTYDEGENAGVSETTGPFWEVDTNFEGRFPVGVGTLPSGKVLNVGDTGGEEKHTITQAELPNVGISTKSIRRTNAKDGGDAIVFSPPAPSAPWNDQTPMMTESLNGDDEETEGGNNMPPYRVISVIKRSARIYYRGA